MQVASHILCLEHGVAIETHVQQQLRTVLFGSKRSGGDNKSGKRQIGGAN